MSIWDDDNTQEENSVQSNIQEEGNPYLKSPERALDLIAKLLPKMQKDEESKSLQKIGRMLDNDILSTLRNTSKGKAVWGPKLVEFSEKVAEYEKIRLLSGKSIVGIGGKFSAGKSRFINSMFGDRQILPEDQNTTTSIPTYIIGGTEEEICAYAGGKSIRLDSDEMQAMTHQFYDNYRIGFSRFVENIVICSPAFPSSWKDRLVFLDTPGYNKSSQNTRDNLTDEYAAEQHLKVADFLIWLVDIDNGVVHGNDIEFIGKLTQNKRRPVLLVFNKADKKTESECESIVTDSRNILREQGIEIEDATAYSSKDCREYFGKNLVREFLDHAAESKDKHDFGAELEGLICSIDEELRKEFEAAQAVRNKLGDSISRSQDIDISSLADVYGRFCQRSGMLSADRKKFQKIAAEIRASFAKLGQA